MDKNKNQLAMDLNSANLMNDDQFDDLPPEPIDNSLGAMISYSISNQKDLNINDGLLLLGANNDMQNQHVHNSESAPIQPGYNVQNNTPKKNKQC